MKKDLDKLADLLEELCNHEKYDLMESHQQTCGNSGIIDKHYFVICNKKAKMSWMVIGSTKEMIEELEGLLRPRKCTVKGGGVDYSCAK